MSLPYQIQLMLQSTMSHSVLQLTTTALGLVNYHQAKKLVQLYIAMEPVVRLYLFQ